MAKSHKTPRHRARCLALQALYQWQLAQTDPEEIRLEFYASQDMHDVDKAYFDLLFKNVTQSVAVIDQLFTPFLDRAISALNPIECAILRLATYELNNCPDVPYKVVINEALELAKTYGSTDGHKYVNGVLDRLARQLRADELT